MSALTGAVAYAFLICTTSLLAKSGVAIEAAGHLHSVATLLPGAIAVVCVTMLYARPPASIGAAAWLGAAAGGIGIVIGYTAAGILIATGILPDPTALAADQIAALPLDVQADARALLAFLQSPAGRLVDAVLGVAASVLGSVAAQWLLTRLRRRRHVGVAAAA